MLVHVQKRPRQLLLGALSLRDSHRGHRGHVTGHVTGNVTSNAPFPRRFRGAPRPALPGSSIAFPSAMSLPGIA
eukprot:3874609-Rhodomonas_salina.2